MGDEFVDPATGEKRPLVTMYGRWADIGQLGYTSVLPRNRYQYFESCESLWRATNVVPTTYSKAEMDVEFAEFAHLQQDSTFRADDWGEYIERLLRIEDGYFWRRPAPGEKLYHRFDDDSVCIPLSHFRAGLRFPPHKFLMDLFRLYFRCPLAQMSPNSIRSINWFIASCEAVNKQPTFRAFFCLFDVKASRAKPFYELQFVKSQTRIGKALDGFRPFVFPKGMAGWQEEFLVVGGGELAWHKNFVKKVECSYRTDRNRLSQVEINYLVRLVKALGEVWNEGNLIDPVDLRRHCCKFLFCFCPLVSCYILSVMFCLWFCL